MGIDVRVGDAREVLRTMPDESVQCVISSPPYWGLRSYHGDPGMIGLEPTFDEHLQSLVAVFREVRRVLRPDGTLWLNYGDAYSGSWGAQSRGDASEVNGLSGGQVHAAPKGTHTGSTKRTGLKPKDLMLMPARVAMALQSDGWWLRSEIVWHKPNPMPESVTDRPTSAHEKLFLLSKSARYFYDAEAVRVPVVDPHRGSGNKEAKTQAGLPDGHANAHRATSIPWQPTTGQANLRNVWTIPTHGYSEAHFATFPPALVEPCIKAGTSEKGACAECGAPWVREGDKRLVPTAKAAKTGVIDARDYAADANDGGANRQKDGHVPGHRNEFTTTGWSPSCGCKQPDFGAPYLTEPCVVLDPFGGSGTVGLVADRLQRDAILIEISPDYADMARRRVTEDAPLFASTEAAEQCQ